MSKAEDPQKARKSMSPFVPLDTLEEGFKMVHEGAKKFVQTLIWTPDQGYQFETRVTELSAMEKALFCWRPPVFDLKKFTAELAAKQTSDAYFSVSLDRATLYFKAKFIEESPSGLKFGIPQSFYKVQRRQNMRHSLFNDAKAWVEFPDPLFPQNILKKKIFDISAGGMAFLITQQDAPLFPSGLVLNPVQFVLNSRPISLSAEILHTNPFSADKKNMGMRVGIKFKAIAAADADFISAFVFGQTQKMFSRLT